MTGNSRLIKQWREHGDLPPQALQRWPMPESESTCTSIEKNTTAGLLASAYGPPYKVCAEDILQDSSKPNARLTHGARARRPSSKLLVVIGAAGILFMALAGLTRFLA